MDEQYNEHISSFEYYQKYKCVLDKLNKRNEIQKKASLKYFNSKKKNETTFCNDCDVFVKTISYKAHLNTKKHLKCVEFKNKIKELQKLS